MASSTLEQLLREIEMLEPADRSVLRRKLEDMPMETPGGDEKDQERREEALSRRLLERGLIRQLPKPRSSVASIPLPELVEVEGEPVSETLVRERR